MPGPCWVCIGLIDGFDHTVWSVYIESGPSFNFESDQCVFGGSE